MPFEFRTLEIPDVILVIPKVFKDNRGFLVETFKQSDFNTAGIRESFVQDNHSKSENNILRGIHFQKAPMEQGKLVRCISGRIWDVAVDIRKKSRFFRKWVGVELSDKNAHMLYIPPSFAHGFLVLSDTADVVYKCTNEYSKEHERGIAWNDTDIGIQWPIQNPVLSNKDAQNPRLRDIDV